MFYILKQKNKRHFEILFKTPFSDYLVSASPRYNNTIATPIPATIEVTILTNAPPIITPTAKSITFPLVKKSLNTLNIFFFMSF